MTATSSLPRPPSGRRWRLWLLVGAGGLLVLWLLVSVGLLISAARTAEAARDDVAAVRDDLTVDQLLEPDGDAGLWEAHEKFERADRRANSPLLAPLKILPFGGRQLRSFAALTAASADGLGLGLDALDRAQAILDRGVPTGRQRVDVLRELSEVLDQAGADVAALDLGPDGALVGPLADARESLVEEIQDVRDLLSRGRKVTDGLARMMDGSRYLVLAANNVEMRNGSGMALLVGTLEASDGELELGELASSSDVNPPFGSVRATGDMQALWGFLHPGDFRNVNLTTRFDRSGELAMRLWDASGGDPVDGVLALDPFALRAVLEATGPVETAGVSVGADTVLELLFHDQYLGDVDDPERYEQLGEIARAALDALSESDVDAGTLAEELAGAAEGRHILAYSPAPAMQEAWEAAGVDGSMDEESLMVSVVNRGANKMDYFLDVDAEIGMERRDDDIEVTVTVALENTIGEGEPQYMAGPNRGLDRPYGEYRGWLALTVPGAATEGAVDGLDRPEVAGPDGPTRVMGVRVVLLPGEGREVVFRFRLPEGHPDLRVEPSARPWPVRVSAGDREWDDDEPVSVALPS